MTEAAGTVQRLVAVKGMWYCGGCEEPLVNGTITHLVSCGEVPVSGSALSRMQVAGHGVDRYPTVAAQYAKVLDEAGELGEALMNRFMQHHVHDDDGTVEGCPGCFADVQERAVYSELADVGLALYALGNKLGIDPIAAMRELVSADERTFA
jgi:hypothetical protein